MWFPNWPIQHLYRNHSQRNHQILIASQDYRGIPRVKACSRRASNCGIRRDMSLSEAKMLATASQSRSRYPHSGSETIIIQPYNDQESHRDLENLAQWCHQFSPLVSIDFTPFRECIFVDVTGCQKMFSGISQLVTKLLTALYSRHYCCLLYTSDAADE